MGQTVSIYLSDEALSKLDELVEARRVLYSQSANPSNTLCDLICQQAAGYIKTMKQLQEAVEAFTTGKFTPERKPINIEEYETFDSMEEYAEKLGVADE